MCETGGRRSQRFFPAAVRRVGMTPAQGALPLLWAGTTRARSGALYTPALGELGSAGAPAVARSLPEPGAMATLWRVWDGETGITFDLTPRP